MTTMPSSAALAVIEPAFSETEKLALAGFLAGYSGIPERPTRWTCASSPRGAAADISPYSPPAALTSSCSPATWKPPAGQGRL